MSWDDYFMGIAEAVSRNSKCGSRKIGSVIVRDHRIISTGYNGPPSGSSPCWRTYNYNADRLVKDYLNQSQQGRKLVESECPRLVGGYKSGEGLQFCIAAHAEVNAIITAARMGVSVDDAILYCNCPIPCKSCAGYIINAGIKEVVCNSLDEYETTISSWKLFAKGSVKVRLPVKWDC